MDGEVEKVLWNHFKPDLLLVRNLSFTEIYMWYTDIPASVSNSMQG